MLLKFDVQCAMVLDFSAKLVEMPVILACLAVKMSDACAIRPDSGLMCSADYRPGPIYRGIGHNACGRSQERPKVSGRAGSHVSVPKERFQLNLPGISNTFGENHFEWGDTRFTENRRFAYVEPCEFLGFSENSFKLEILGNLIDY